MVRRPGRTTLGVTLGVVLVWLLTPGSVEGAVAGGLAAVARGFVWSAANLPPPVFLSGVLVVSLSVLIVFVYLLARVGYWLARHARPYLGPLGHLVPRTPYGKLAAFFLVMLLGLGGVTLALPGLVGGSAAADIIAGDDGGATDMTGDAVRPGGGSDVPYQRPSADADGDLLADAWERRNRTPGGAALPGADPDRMDLYVTIHYASDVNPLSTAELTALRRVWANMPVDNPDGSRGIALHVRTEPLGGTAAFSGPEGDLDAYYTPQYIGERRCVAHQVVVGRITRPDVAGAAHAPGYVSVVDGTVAPAYNGSVPYRVHLLTHLLLHNVVGDVGSGTHTDRGWLAPTIEPDNAALSPGTAARLSREGLVGSGYYQREVCN